MKSTSHSARALAVALILGIGMFLVGCGAEASDQSDSSGSSQSDQAASSDGEEAAPEEADSTGFVDEDGDVPGWMADGFPIFPGSVVAGSGESQGTTIISFSVPSADAQEIYDWFLAAYAKDGWGVRDSDADSGRVEAENADGRTASINVTKATFVLSAAQG